MIVLMSRRSLSYEEMAAEFGVSTKTSRRDLAAIEGAGVPVYEVNLVRECDEPKRFRVDSHFARSIL